jgi:hypothetical protein
MEQKKLTGRGGPGRGQGRKPKVDKVETAVVAVRMSLPQRDKLERLGGAPWVRERIDKAKVPQDE